MQKFHVSTFKRLPRPSSSHQRVIKLSSVQTLLVIGPGWGRHAAVRVQQDPDAADEQKEEQQHQKSDEAQGRSPLGVLHRGLQLCGPSGEPQRSLRGEVIVYHPVICVAHLGIMEDLEARSYSEATKHGSGLQVECGLESQRAKCIVQ